MITTKVTRDLSNTIDLCETYSIEGYKLLQQDTGIIYGKSVIDPIAGYDENNLPYSRHTYIETDELDIEDLPSEETDQGGED